MFNKLIGVAEFIKHMREAANIACQNKHFDIADSLYANTNKLVKATLKIDDWDEDIIKTFKVNTRSADVTVIGSKKLAVVVPAMIFNDGKPFPVFIISWEKSGSFKIRAYTVKMDNPNCSILQTIKMFLFDLAFVTDEIYFQNASTKDHGVIETNQVLSAPFYDDKTKIEKDFEIMASPYFTK